MRFIAIGPVLVQYDFSPGGPYQTSINDLNVDYLFLAVVLARTEYN